MDECCATYNLSKAGFDQIQTILYYSKQYEDKLIETLKKSLKADPHLTVDIHGDCVSTYCSKLHFKHHLKRISDENKTGV